ncbi:DUF4143 domain-containing protein [Nocardia sp. NPDC051981]|uniref:DUF4143 domain-containing protein n=1 Tax=Nocardia sp. NPDC051981 TaxID=3155417 RepID=UPI00341C0ACE
MRKSSAENYLRLLEAVFLVHRLPAWGTALGSRIARQPKLHVVDSGVAAWLLGLTPAKIAMADPAVLTQYGHLTETFAVAREKLVNRRSGVVRSSTARVAERPRQEKVSGLGRLGWLTGLEPATPRHKIAGFLGVPRCPVVARIGAKSTVAECISEEVSVPGCPWPTQGIGAQKLVMSWKVRVLVPGGPCGGQGWASACRGRDARTIFNAERTVGYCTILERFRGGRQRLPGVCTDGGCGSGRP